MDEERPYDVPAAEEHQPDEEAAAAAADVVWDAWPEDAAPMQQEDVAELLYFVDQAATENDEAIAQSLYMEQLREMEEQDGGMRGFEEPCAAGAGGATPDVNQLEPMAGFEEPRPAGAFAGSGGAMPDVNQLEPVPDIFGGAANAHQQANNYWNHHRAAGHGKPEVVTLRLEPRRDALISARQTVLADASSIPAVLAGMEEDAEDDGWYDSIAQEAQRIEQLDNPELYDDGEPFRFQQLRLRRSESPAREEERDLIPTNVAAGEEFSLQNFTKRWGVHPSELDPDEPGPSTKRQARVPPLADAEVPTFVCGICIKTLPVLDLFHGMQCDHRFCVECMATYIEVRIHSGEVPIPCPDPACKRDEDHNNNGRALHPEECKKSIDFAAFGTWGDRLTERAIPPSRRTHCPNRQCGVMLETTGGKTPDISFCPACSHAMCASCGMDWGVDGSRHDCDGRPEAALVKKIPAERRRKQCPKCKMLVERTSGCRVMRCRCLFLFCYDCGRQMPWAEAGPGERCECRD